MTRGIHCEERIQPVEADSVSLSLVDVPSEEECAISRCWRAEEDAGAGNVTVAGFKVDSREIPF